MGLFFTEIAGNNVLKQQLGARVRANTLSHAFIVEGPRGSGKHTLALHVAAALACQKRADESATLPCLDCPSCKKILSGNSPDVITIGREDKATLGVEAIRRLKGDVIVAPNDTDVKVYLIEDAHLMTVQAQNAFLLTLEEPPKYVLFFLLCESAAPLLETIRSRTQTIHTEPISTVVMDEYLCRTQAEARSLKSTNPTEYRELLAIADGRIGAAIELLSPAARKPHVERRALAKEFARLASEQKNASATLRYLNSLGQKRDTLTANLSVILLCLRDLLICKQTDNPTLCFFADAEDAHELAYRFTTPALLTLCNAVDEAIDRLRMNANVRLTLLSLAVNAGLIQL